jgi:hypothetical protein
MFSVHLIESITRPFPGIGEKASGYFLASMEPDRMGDVAGELISLYYDSNVFSW